MTDTTAKIRTKGCETTGLTEDLARKLFDTGVGKHIMAIVELRVVQPHGPDVEGKRSIDLVITQVEPAMDNRLEDHLRGLTRALHNQRRLNGEDDQPQPEGVSDVEPTVEEVVRQGQGVLPEAPEDESDEDREDEGTIESLTCSNCLHKLDDEAINHEPESSDESCTWAACGHIVHTDSTRCTKPECEEAAVPAGV